MEITLEAVLLEADKVNIDATPGKMDSLKSTNNTDYGAEEEEGTVDGEGANTEEEEAPDDNTDYGADEPPEDEEPTEEEPPADDAAEGEDTGTDYGADEEMSEDDMGGGEDEGTDYGGDMGGDEGSDDMGGDTGDETSSDTPAEGEETPEQLDQRNVKVKQLLLLKNMIALYNSVKNYNDAILSMEKPNIVASAIQNTVSSNFSKLYLLIYKYIMYYYDKMSYEYNLYTYNYFIEACKINVELLSKIMKPAEAEE